MPFQLYKEKNPKKKIFFDQHIKYASQFINNYDMLFLATTKKHGHPCRVVGLLVVVMVFGSNPPILSKLSQCLRDILALAYM